MGAMPDDAQRWAESGAGALTGHPGDGWCGPPAPLLPGLDRLTASIAERTSDLGHRVDLDGPRVLVERAAASGLTRHGRTSCGGSTRLLATADGWIAVSLARPDDVDLVPAWLGIDPIADLEDGWGAAAGAIGQRGTSELDASAAELGIPTGALPRIGPPTDAVGVVRTPITPRSGSHPARRHLADVVVVDLSSLWAGPLATSILADAGARIIKVESTTRPDGARVGPSRFFDLMNAGKLSVALDLARPDGRATLLELVAGADVVVEASRPRALQQMGIDSRRLMSDACGPQVWLTITGHGRGEHASMRVGFGDDCSVAGGLVSRDDAGDPVFCSDAAADPCAGLAAAAAVLEALVAGGRWTVDVALAGVAAEMSGPPLPAPTMPGANAPRIERDRGRARALGVDTSSVLAEMGLA